MYTRSGRRARGLGDLLTDTSLPLTPDNLNAGYNLDPYNRAVADYTALHEERERLWNEAIAANGGVYPGGTAAQVLVLAPELAAAQKVVQDFEARIRAIDAARRALTPTEQADADMRSRFLAWFENGFKPIFSTSLGSTTNEDTLRRDIAAEYPGHPEWADEVIAWVRSSSVAWKLAPGSQPPPVPGAVSVTYPGGVTVTPAPGELAPAPPRSGGITPPSQIDYGPLPPGSVPAAGVPIPPSWQQPTVPPGYTPTPRPSSGDGAYDGGPSDDGDTPRPGGAPLQAGFGGLGALVLVGAVVGALVLNRKGRRPRGYRRY